MSQEKSTHEQLQALLIEYAKCYPDAVNIYQPFFISDEQMLNLLREANGREIIFDYPADQLDSVKASFREPNTLMPLRANELTLQELLYSRGLPPYSKTKIVRHLDKKSKLDLLGMYRDHFLKFQSYQSRQKDPVFHKCDYIVSLLGEESSTARFVGVYQVTGVEQGDDAHYYYKLSPVPGFDDLTARVIIHWGAAAVQWAQWFTAESPKRVVEIQRFGAFEKPFTDYLDFTLTFEELRRLVKVDGANPVWQRMLSAVAGIYLIVDTSQGNPTSGHHYVGSAYGNGGIWQRWKSYVDTNGHGDNKALKTLTAADPNYARHFQFTVLMILSRTTAEQEVIRWEQKFKKKLGTRLNLN